MVDQSDWLPMMMPTAGFMPCPRKRSGIIGGAKGGAREGGLGRRFNLL
jgi:hypothetical protein